MAGAIRLPVVGLPTSDEEPLLDGRRSRFDNGDIYWKDATGAWEIHGAIRDRWTVLGGASGFLGYPTSDELSVESGPTEVGRSNAFEDGVIYWSPATGAFECNGEIQKQYVASGGPSERSPFRRPTKPTRPRAAVVRPRIEPMCGS